MNASRRPDDRRSFHGFTLVELLVVMAIVALLISLLLPALSQARKAALGVRCQANLRQIGVGVLAYMVENTTFPSAAVGGQSYGLSMYMRNGAGAGYTGYGEYFTRWARDYGLAPNMASNKSFEPADHGLFVCPAKDMPQKSQTDAWHISYLTGHAVALSSYVNRFGMSSDPSLYNDVLRFYSPDDWATNGSSRGRGPIRPRGVTHTDGLPLFFDVLPVILTPATEKRTANHPDYMNTIYYSGAVFRQKPDPIGHGSYTGASSGDPRWYFPYVRYAPNPYY